MCLPYGTPHRFRLVYTQGADFPLECHDKTTLRHLLQEEFAAGYYDTPDYHPLLVALLRGLMENETALPQNLQEPAYPYCDLLQSVGLIFCFVENSKRWVPDTDFQGNHMLYGNPIIRMDVYAIVRVILTQCCPAEVVEQWYEQLACAKRAASQTPPIMAFIDYIETGLIDGTVMLTDGGKDEGTAA